MFRTVPTLWPGGLPYSILPQGLPTTVYCDPNAPLWVVQHGHDYPGQSLYFVSEDGKKFFEYLEIGRDSSGGTRTVSLEGVRFEKGVPNMLKDCWEAMRENRPVNTNGIRKKRRFERADEGAKLFDETEEGDVLMSDSLALVALGDVEGVLSEGRFDDFSSRIIAERIAAGDVSAVLAYGIRNSSYRSGHVHFPREHLPNVIEKAKDDMCAFGALCILAGQYATGTEEALMEHSIDRLMEAARYYRAPRRSLWKMAKDGDRDALEAMRSLALDSDLAVRDLLNLFSVWKVDGSADALKTIPIDGREIKPHDLEDFVKAGHPDAEGLLSSLDPAKYVEGAEGNSYARDLLNSHDVNQLGILVRHNNQKALDGLFALHADGHYAARLMIKKLVDEGFMTKGVLTAVDLAPLKEKASTDPMAVIALHNLHNDGHPDALRVLRELDPVDGLLRQASTDYNAIGAIYFLDGIGNPRIREGINAVSIHQWEEWYNLRGQAKLEGREARDSMAILARLGNEAACRHENVAIPKRAAAALRTLAVVAELKAQGHDVQIVNSGAPSIAEEGEKAGNENSSDDDEDVLN